MPTYYALQGSVLGGTETVRTRPFARVEVKLESSGALAQLFTDVDGTTSAGNPIDCDYLGGFLIYLVQGVYRIQITTGGLTQVLRHYLVGGTGDAGVVSARFDAMADLVSSTEISVGQRISIRGYQVAGDAPEAVYQIVAAGTATADGLSVVNLNGIPGQAIAVAGRVDAMFGAAATGDVTARTALANVFGDLATPYFFSALERIRPEWAGAKGDKSDAAATSLAIGNAAGYAARTGKILRLERAAEYALSAQLALPSGLRIENAGAVFHPQFAPSNGDDPIVLVGDDVVADQLAGHLDAGIGVIGRMFRIGSRCRIGSCTVTSYDHIANGSVLSSNTGGAILFKDAVGSNVDRIEVENYRCGWAIDNCADIIVGYDRLRAVWQATRWQLATNCHLHGGISEHAVKADRDTGDLGFIGAGLQNCSISDRRVIDCGEHAFRLGGDGLYNDLIAAGMEVEAAKALASSDGFALKDCTAVRSLGCGFKTQPGQYTVNRNIRVSGHVGEDIANGKGGGVNSSFIRLTNSTGITLIGCRNRARAQAYSGVRGISIEGCDYVTCRGVDLDTTQEHAVFVTTSNPDGASNSISDMDLDFTTTRPGSSGFELRVVADTDVVRRFRLRIFCFDAVSTGLILGTRPNGTTPLLSNSFMVLEGDVAFGASPAKNIAAAYTSGNRFADRIVYTS